VGRSRRELNVIEMKLRRLDWEVSLAEDTTEITPAEAAHTGIEADGFGFADADLDPGEVGESEADRAARLERRRARREYRRLRDVLPEEPATSPGSDDDQSISPS
jgi:hypothetical protein